MHTFEMIFVDVTGPYAKLLRYLEKNQPGFELEEFLEDIFAFAVAQGMGLIKDMDLLDLINSFNEVEETDPEEEENEQGDGSAMEMNIEIDGTISRTRTSITGNHDSKSKIELQSLRPRSGTLLKRKFEIINLKERKSKRVSFSSKPSNLGEYVEVRV
eukprot:TRINITY_DN3070_c0_g1_i1.p1 TRINITY_DN3070_c0_g1~~TRINITY_DN3070_c0_g1_i1.p1  ORF type:complete len:158 (-),score=22.43 TRINITY_DN3070_c0_g1_i1:159-632(-)